MSSLFGLGGGGNVGASGSFYETTIDQSLRFPNTDSGTGNAYLNRTPSSAGNRRTWTWSAWVKRSKLGNGGANQSQLIWAAYDGGDADQFQFGDTNNLRFYLNDAVNANIQTTAVYRDVSSWYHIVLAVDTTQATAADRVSIYVNGEEVTDFSTSTYPTQNYQTDWNNSVAHTIGQSARTNSTQFFCGYMAEVNFIDGTALDADSFGETSNGVWVPKEYTGSYGTNGFYLSFADSAAPGRDKAGSKTLVTSTSFSTIGGGTTNFSQSEADKGFDNDKSTNVDRTGTSGLIEITPTSSVTPVSHTMINAASGSYTAASRPNSVKLQGSNDGGSTWTDIDTLTNGSGANTATTSSFSNTTSYAKLRLNIASNHGGSNTRFAEYVVFASEDNGDGENIFFKEGLAAHDVVPDSPTLIYPTWNPLVNTGQTLTFAEGNLNLDASSTFWSSGTWNQSTMGVLGGSDAKYYFEFTMNGNTSGSYVIGVGRQNSKAIDTTHYTGGVVYYYNRCSSDSTNTVTGLTIASSLTIIRLAFDASNGKVWIGDNTGWFNSGDPAAGTGEVGTISGYDGEMLVAILNRSTNTGDQVVNFGQDDTFAGFKTSGSASATDDNGYGTFYYTPPTGFLALNSASLPEPAIGPNIDANDSGTTSDEHFNTVLWSGNSTNNRSITTGHATDLVWIKKRGTTVQTHVLADSVRGTSDNGGTGNVGILAPNSTAAVSTNSSDSGIASFDSTGFTIGAGSNTANADAPYQGTNASGHTYVGWSWKAGGTAVSNSDGSLACNVSANTDAGFSIVSWTANSDNGTLGHGLDSAPELIIAKPMGSGTNWYVMHTPGGVVPATNILNLDSNADDFNPGVNHFNDTYPTDTVFSYGGYLGDDLSDDDKVAYCFHSVYGYSDIGFYRGNSSGTDGPFVLTNFRPAWIMGKAIGQTGRWWMYDSARTTYNDGGVNNGRRLEANTTAIEKTTDSSNMVEFYSNGFKVNTTNSEWNGSGLNYIYLAFAEAPFKYANAR